MFSNVWVFEQHFYFASVPDAEASVNNFSKNIYRTVAAVPGM